VRWLAAPRRAVGSRLVGGGWRAVKACDHEQAPALRTAHCPLPTAYFPPPTAHCPLPTAHSSRGLTLIELLVTIVILVTLLAAVLPAISPNNEGRKVREATRQLTSLFAQAQAQAARDGREIGVSFGETVTWNDANDDNLRQEDELTRSGMALEAFVIAEPPPFAGFSEASAVGVVDPNTNNLYAQLFNNLPPIGPNDPPLVNLVFGHNVGGEAFASDPSDAIPPRTFRGAVYEQQDDGTWQLEGAGDLVQIGREVFELLRNDYDNNDNDNDDVNDEEQTSIGAYYLKSQTTIAARWLTWRYRSAELAPRGGKAYRIRRRPMHEERPSRTSAAALQFPRAIGIDMDATEGNSLASIMFSPTGALGAEYHDDHLQDDRHDVFILLGRVENANPVGLSDFDVDKDGDVDMDDVDVDLTFYDCRDVVTDDELAQKRREVNLFNPDSRWVAISPSGRVVAAENYIFDPRELLDDPDNPSQGTFLENLSGTEFEQLDAQRERFRWEAQTYARQFQSDSGR
jgi:prepilin-type N-terminal cleavage/methylation domain-containing protein